MLKILYLFYRKISKVSFWFLHQTRIQIQQMWQHRNAKQATINTLQSLKKPYLNFQACSITVPLEFDISSLNCILNIVCQVEICIQDYHCYNENTKELALSSKLLLNLFISCKRETDIYEETKHKFLFLLVYNLSF